MRGLATELGTTQAALYWHVRDKAELDDLMVGKLCSQVTLPEPDTDRWIDQALDVCRQLRDQYLSYPGVWRATMPDVAHNVEMLRINEALLAILVAGGAEVRAADAAFSTSARTASLRPGEARGHRRRGPWNG